MQLSLEDVQQFFRLHRSLMFFVNQRLQVLDEDIADPDAYSHLPLEARFKVHAALLEHLEMIDAFADENPFQFDEDDVEIVRSWKHLVAGTFYVFRYLRNYAVFLSSTEPVLAYGVLALFDPFEVVVGPDLPRMIKTTLLPFRGRIVYDSLMRGYNIFFGPGIRRSLNESYKEAKERFGIIMSLPFDPAAHPPIEKKLRSSRRAKAGTSRGGSAGPAAARAAHDRIVTLTDAFCREHLDDEYAALCRKLAGVQARKRPSPLTQGKPESWASGIVRAIGWVNFLGDPSQPHHMKMTDIDRGFGVSEATGSAKATAIRKLLRLHRFDPEWTVPSMIDQNPLAWMIMVNGLMVDARRLPREIQEEAYRKRLDPLHPGPSSGRNRRGVTPGTLRPEISPTSNGDDRPLPARAAWHSVCLMMPIWDPFDLANRFPKGASAMAKYSKKSQEKVKETMHEFKEGKLKSGKSEKKVTNPKQAIAIGLSKARKSGAKVPSKKG